MRVSLLDGVVGHECLKRRETVSMFWAGRSGSAVRVTLILLLTSRTWLSSVVYDHIDEWPFRWILHCWWWSIVRPGGSALRCVLTVRGRSAPRVCRRSSWQRTPSLRLFSGAELSGQSSGVSERAYCNTHTVYNNTTEHNYFCLYESTEKIKFRW